MSISNHSNLYKSFGDLVRSHRERLEGMTQEKLGHLIGLSRTSITNIESGRQNVALHQFFAIAEALKVQPSTLLPKVNSVPVHSKITDKMPPNTDPEIAAWAENVFRNQEKTGTS